MATTITPDEMLSRIRKLHATEVGMSNYTKVLKETFYVMYQMALALKEIKDPKKVPVAKVTPKPEGGPK
jgi:hypothetical protein